MVPLTCRRRTHCVASNTERLRIEHRGRALNGSKHARSFS
jgi:hypothetical protein